MRRWSSPRTGPTRRSPWRARWRRASATSGSWPAPGAGAPSCRRSTSPRRCGRSCTRRRDWTSARARRRRSRCRSWPRSWRSAPSPRRRPRRPRRPGRAARRRSIRCAGWRSWPPTRRCTSTSAASASGSAARGAARATPSGTPAMSPTDSGFVTGLVLAAGGSRRLGQPKQLLPYGDATLLGHVLATARACGLHQLVCAIGGGAAAIRGAVDLSGVEVVENRRFGEGCSSSIAAALDAVDERSQALVLMLGDQPRVTTGAVTGLLAGRGDAPLAACLYEDGRGHPLAFARSTFADLAALHGDKGIWKLMDRRAGEVVDVPVGGRIPLDVDTWEDYRAALAARP